MNDTDNMMQETTATISVLIASKNHDVNLTIDWNGMTPRELQELAQKRLIIAYQTRMKANGIVPNANDVISALDYRANVRAARTITLKPEMMTREQLEHFSKLIANALAAKQTQE